MRLFSVLLPRRRRVSGKVLGVILGLALLSLGAGLAQNGYSLNWYTVDGGGAAGTGTGFTVNGTVGQADAGLMSAPGYAVSGGFWAGHTVPWNDVFLPWVSR